MSVAVMQARGDMKNRIIFIAFLFFASTYAIVAGAKLSSSKFEDMVKESDLIIIAKPVDIYLRQYSGGYANLKIEKVVKGEYKKSEVKITWSSEVHDSKVKEFGRYILFLRKEGEKYVSTHYGRGIWPIYSSLSLNKNNEFIDEYRDYIEYEYPVDVLEFNKGIIKRIKEEEYRRNQIQDGDCKKPITVKGIYLDELISLIVGMK